MNKTGVVILNWNGLKLLEEYLPIVIKNTPDADVIVADNASTDGSVEWIRDNYPGLRLIVFRENYGYAGGYNRAIEELCDYENIILLNSDAYPAEGWIKPLENLLSLSHVAGVQPKILKVSDPREFEYAGAAGGFLDSHGYPYCRGRIFGTVEKDEGQYDDIAEIFWASGAALAVKRSAYLQCGGLDETFFAHMEEIDLCWRMKLNGGKIMYQPQSRVFHQGGGSLDALSPKKTYLNFRNNLLMLYKNLPKDSRKKRVLFVRRLLDTVAMVKFMAEGGWQHAQAIFKAHNDFRKMRKSYTIFPDVDLIAKECRRNILTDYYLKGKRRFRD